MVNEFDDVKRTIGKMALEDQFYANDDFHILVGFPNYLVGLWFLLCPGEDFGKEQGWRHLGIKLIEIEELENE